jgi:hypothetical protein
MNKKYLAFSLLLPVFVACSSSTPASTAAPGGLGAACTKYYGTCCTENANAIPAGATRDAAVKACTDAKTTAAQSLTSGTSTAQLEDACQKGIDLSQMQGRCK